jgi:hypothetical protein
MPQQSERVKKLTAIDLLGSLLLLLASTVLSGLLNSKTSLGACKVGVAVVVHGLLQGVAFPAENIVAVGGGAATKGIS